jgi:hypothetical protein
MTAFDLERVRDGDEARPSAGAANQDRRSAGGGSRGNARIRVAPGVTDKRGRPAAGSPGRRPRLELEALKALRPQLVVAGGTRQPQILSIYLRRAYLGWHATSRGG